MATVKSLRSGSTVTLWCFSETAAGAKNGFPIAFGNNLSVQKMINATEEFGIGAHRTQETVLHDIRFRMSLRQALMFNKLLTELGVMPVDANWMTFNAPNMYVVDLVSGDTALGIYGMLVSNHTYNFMQRQTVSQNIAAIVKNVLDSYELGLSIVS